MSFTDPVVVSSKAHPCVNLKNSKTLLKREKVLFGKNDIRSPLKIQIIDLRVSLSFLTAVKMKIAAGSVPKFVLCLKIKKKLTMKS